MPLKLWSGIVYAYTDFYERSAMYTFIAAPIFHSTAQPYCCRLDDGCLVVRVRVNKGLAADKVFVRIVPEGEEICVRAVKLNRKNFSIAKRFSEDWEWWEANLKVEVPLLNYRFICVTASGTFNYNAKGLCSHTPLDRDDFKISFLNEPPQWVEDSIFYQIFPDRFCCGDSSTNVKDGEYSLAGQTVRAFDWEAPLDKSCGNVSFYGGDLPGITAKLPYLQELGINALYLNPIFTSPSNHKYDVADYYNVDPHFGGNDALAELRRASSLINMRLVLDLVPNHCGNQNTWFKKAQTDKNSLEYAFFTFYNDNPEQYEMWLGVRTLPRLNYCSQELRKRMYLDCKSVMRRWLLPPYSIDGWRIDVANMLARQKMDQLGHEIGKEMRRAVKEENSQAWILGEQFFDPSDYQQGDEFDASMNYRAFCMPVNQWMAGFDFEGFKGHEWGCTTALSSSDLAEQMQSFRAAIPEKNALNMLNLVGSHDLPRVKTFNQGRADKAAALYTMLFAYQGVPCIYYGDEIGLEGGPDPDNRRTMIWDEDKWDKNMLSLMKRLCVVRKQSSALRRGGLQWLIAQDNSLVFMREDKHSRAICTIVREGQESQSKCPKASIEYLSIPVQAAALAEGVKFRGAVSGKIAQVKNGCLAILPSCLGAEIWLEEP
ncbi:MAG: alpha amylase N-terminal ig-like domain-containing protein [Candidatus Bruticola sp.]